MYQFDEQRTGKCSSHDPNSVMVVVIYNISVYMFANKVRLDEYLWRRQKCLR